MPETLDSTKQADANKHESESIREALFRLRAFASKLPPVDAAAVVRDIREAGSHAN
jgi:hypothetical protein